MSFPIGINVADFAGRGRMRGWCKAAASTASSAWTVLDYTKGLPLEVQAFGRFLEKNRIRRQVVLTQIAADATRGPEAYSASAGGSSLAGSISGASARLDWVPIHYIHRSTPPPADRPLPLIPHRHGHALA